MRLRSLPLALLFVSSLALSQSFTPVREQKNLSPAAIDTLHTLETLNALPGGTWRFHAGDIPHGESVTLDDASWPLVPTPTTRAQQVTAPKEAVWYRQTIEVPRTLHGYDLSGSRIWFQFHVDANGPIPQIIYFNGRRVALGDDLEPIILFEPAHPGDKVLVAVKLLQTVDEKRFEGVNMKIEPLDTNTDVSSRPEAASSAAVVERPASRTSTNVRPNPNDIRIEAITAANILPALPTPRKDLLPTVESAVAAIDTKALAAGNQQAFDASLRKAETILAPLHSVLSAAKVDLTGNAHIDAAWLWPRSETIDVVKRTFTTALQLMNEYPDYTYSQSAAQYSEWMADKYPELNKQIAARIKEGRWEIVGGMWVEPDLNLPGGESLVRQLLVGQRYFQQQYGVTARIGWNPDSFGYNWQLPQIYKRSGMDYFVTQKMHWNDTNTLPFRLFWWQSPDGSKVLTYFPTDYVHDNVNPTRISADFAESAERNPGTTEHLDLYGIGDHGGGPTRDMLDQANHWIAMSTPPKDLSSFAPQTLSSFAAGGGSASGPSTNLSSRPERSGVERPASGTTTTTPAAIPTMRYSTAQNYFTHVETHLNPNSPVWDYDSIAKGYTPPPMATGNLASGKLATESEPLIGIPTWNSELYFEYHRGVMTTQANHKRNMRTSETQTLDAEKLASLAWLDGQPYPNDILTENWKKITFNQFHDLAAGSGIAVIYRDAQKDYTEVFRSDALIMDAAIKQISREVDTTSPIKNAQATPFIAVNSLPWKRDGVVEIDLQIPEGGELQFGDGENAPPFVYQFEPDSRTSTTVRALVRLRDVPAGGYEVFHAFLADRVGMWGGMHPDPNPGVLDNGHIRLSINSKSGCIESIVFVDATEKSGSNYLAPHACGNQLQTYADNPKQYDAWNIDPGTLDGKMTPIDTLDSIKVIADGPLRKTIEIKRTWSKSHFTQDISLDAGSDFVRVDTSVDWHEDHVLLKAAFPLAHSGPKATYEIPYGAIERPTTRNNSWEKAQFEVPAQRWADLGDATAGVSILNDSKYGYDALGNTLRLTLLRSPTWPDPDADRGPQHFIYEIYPHTGPWQTAQTVHRGYELNTPLTAQQVFPHTGSLPPTHSFISVDEPNVILSAVKKAEDSNALIFRIYEATGKGSEAHLHIPPGATSITEVNLMESPIAGTVSFTHDTITLPIKPWEIRTLQATYPAKK